MVTPLWKRKSLQSSYYENVPSRKSGTHIKSSSCVNRASHHHHLQVQGVPSPEEARPGSTKPNNLSIVYNPYHPEQSAKITARPAVGEEIRPIGKQEAGNSAWWRSIISRTTSQRKSPQNDFIYVVVNRFLKIKRKCYTNLCFIIACNTELLSFS